MASNSHVKKGGTSGKKKSEPKIYSIRQKSSFLVFVFTVSSHLSFLFPTILCLKTCSKNLRAFANSWWFSKPCKNQINGPFSQFSHHFDMGCPIHSFSIKASFKDHTHSSTQPITRGKNRINNKIPDFSSNETQLTHERIFKSGNDFYSAVEYWYCIRFKNNY